MALTINNPRYGNVFVVADIFAELRSVSSKQIKDGYSAIVAGDLTPGDGFGGMLVWNAASTATDDSRTVIAPQDGQPGRWIKIAVGQVGPVGPLGPVSTVPGPPGLPGASNNTRVTLAALKTAPVSDLTSLYDGSLWTFVSYDFTGLADDINVVQANGVPLSTGAWERGIGNADDRGVIFGTEYLSMFRKRITDGTGNNIVLSGDSTTAGSAVAASFRCAYTEVAHHRRSGHDLGCAFVGSRSAWSGVLSRRRTGGRIQPNPH